MSEVAQTLGQRLKAERERRGVSTQKAADEMHLDSWVIEALEAGDYQRIGPPVYAKGHLKKYATILGLPAAESRVRLRHQARRAGERRHCSPRACGCALARRIRLAGHGHKIAASAAIARRCRAASFGGGRGTSAPP